MVILTATLNQKLLNQPNFPYKDGWYGGDKGPFKFKVVGHKIVKIKNFAGIDPNKWIIDMRDV